MVQSDLIINTTVDSFFLLDIILMFFTSVMNNIGNEEFDSKFIAYKYTNTIRFYFDVLALLGADVFVNL
jgi:hypothetical protein